RFDAVESDRGDVVDGNSEPDGARDVWRTGLELVGQVVPRRLLERNRADHVAAAEKRRHCLEPLGFPVEETDSSRSVQLVTGCGVEVAADRLNVYRHVIRGL